MKNSNKILIIIVVVIIGLGFVTCDEYDNIDGTGGCNSSCLTVGAIGPGGGKIFYHAHQGFKVTGDGSFTAYYLEVAPDNQGDDLAWASTEFDNTNIRGTSTAIGTGKANTAAILKIDKNAPAAKACKEYSNNGKSDWFLPSYDELIQIKWSEALFGISFGIPSEFFWTSSQKSNKDADKCYFGKNSLQGSWDFLNFKWVPLSVRAIRAF